MKIGNVALDNPLVLAPMAGVTDLPFRLLCREQGCGLVYTEMISAKGIYYNNKNTGQLLQIREDERPVSLQLFGSDPDIISEMAKRIEHLNFDILDINMGCPVPKVVNNGEGSALMERPELVGEIVEKTARAIQKPVTVKIRKGFTAEHINAVEIAHIAQESGAAAVAVHARTRTQYYSGRADWGIIRQVKERLTVPVIGNGDVRSPEDVAAMMRETGCDGVMIGRGAQGNPWLFGRALTYLREGRLPPEPDIHAVVQMILRHARMLIDLKGEYTGIREMRKHTAWYTAGFPNSSRLRSRINGAESFVEFEKMLLEFEKMLLEFEETPPLRRQEKLQKINDVEGNKNG